MYKSCKPEWVNAIKPKSGPDGGGLEGLSTRDHQVQSLQNCSAAVWYSATFSFFFYIISAIKQPKKATETLTSVYTYWQNLTCVSKISIYIVITVYSSCECLCKTMKLFPVNMKVVIIVTNETEIWQKLYMCSTRRWNRWNSWWITPERLRKKKNPCVLVVV